jgi:hypothetical protein
VSGAHAAYGPARHPNPRPTNFTQSRALFLSEDPWAILVEFDIGAGSNSQMEIKLSMKILQVAMTIDEARQDGLASDVNHLCMGRNGDLAAPTNSLKLALLDKDDGIVDGRPARAVNQFSTLHHEYFLCHVFFSSFIPINRLLQDRIFLLTLQPGHTSIA